MLKVTGDHSTHLDGEFPLSLSYHVSLFFASFFCHSLSIALETWVYLVRIPGRRIRIQDRLS